MSRVQDNTYITIQAFMVSELDLKGAELLIYAIIYGFSQDGAGAFRGSIQYLADWINGTKRTVYNVLDSLLAKDLIEKRGPFGAGIYEYAVKKFHKGGEKISLLPVKKFHPPGEKISPNNIIDNIEYKIDYNRESFSAEKSDIEKVVDLYHSICKTLPKVKKAETRRTVIKSRLSDSGMEEIKTVFEKAAASDFLSGRNNRGWTASFDWLMKPANFVKVLEGNYDNHKTGKSAPSYDLNAIMETVDDFDPTQTKRRD